MKLHIYFPILLIFGVFKSSSGQERELLSETLRADFNLVTTALKEAHPGLYRYLKKEEFEHICLSIQEKLNKPMTRVQFYQVVAPLIAKIRCGHTKWLLPPDLSLPVLPVHLDIRTRDAAVVADFSDSNPLQPGTIVTAINGQSIPEIKRRLAPYIIADGYSKAGYSANVNESFAKWYAIYLNLSNSYRLSYTKDGKTQSKSVNAISQTTLDSRIAMLHPHSRPFEFSWTSDIPVLTIRSFMADRNAHPFEPFVDSVFDVLSHSGAAAIILDLRNNEGGIEDWGGYLFSYFADTTFVYYDKIEVAAPGPFSFESYAWLPPQYVQARQYIVEKQGKYYWPLQPYLTSQEPKPKGFSGLVYVLINGRSFSVTSEFAAMMQTRKQTKFIGEETGGVASVNNSGVFAIVTLPGSKIELGIPLASFYMNVPNSKGRGILPNKTVPPADYTALVVDPIMETAIRRIKND